MRTHIIQCRAIRLDGIGGTTKLQEARTEAGKSRGGRRVGAIDGGGTECHASVGDVTQGEQSIAKTQVGLIGRSVGGVTGSSGKSLDGTV